MTLEEEGGDTFVLDLFSPVVKTRAGLGIWMMYYMLGHCG